MDTAGNLDGYSLGYFVGKKPYGYAIYSIESSSIREFVFCQDVENLYKELEDKAEECDNVDEDNLINGIVYEGGIDYCTFDKGGNKVEYVEESRLLSEDENFTEYSDSVDKILGSKYVLDENLYGGYISELCDSLNYWDVYNQNTFLGWNIVPDSGLAMITQNYSTNKLKKYCCGVNSMTGILNWMGYSSVDSIYNDLWNNAPVTDIKYNYNIEAYDGGVLPSALKSYVNKTYFSDISTEAYMDWDLTFSDITNHIGTTSAGERAPFYMSITINSFDDVTGEYRKDENGNNLVESHGVVGLSYIITKENNFVGIWNSWFIDPKDNETNEDNLIKNVDNNYAYRSIRYINYNDLINRDNVSIFGIMFKNVSSRNIKEVRTNYISGNEIELACIVPNGTKHVYFPTWTASSNGSDVAWHEGQIQTGNVATISIDLSTYNHASGLYVTHIYAYDNNMNQLACYKTLYNNIDSTISNVIIKNKTIKGYTLTCDLPTGVTKVAFPTWSLVNGQDDLVWYEGNVINCNEKIKGEVTIDVANHKNNGGIYVTHIYAYDKYNNIIAYDESGRATITDRKTITDVKVSNVTQNSYKVTCKIPTGTSYVWFPTWTSNNGQDDIIWYDAKLSAETAYLYNKQSKS